MKTYLPETPVNCTPFPINEGENVYRFLAQKHDGAELGRCASQFIRQHFHQSIIVDVMTGFRMAAIKERDMDAANVTY
jgi:hypothetical protein